MSYGGPQATGAWRKVGSLFRLGAGLRRGLGVGWKRLAAARLPNHASHRR
ncbi:MAG: hypothetical protein ACJASX_002236, partial [Limisphaerales bacterium]